MMRAGEDIDLSWNNPFQSVQIRVHSPFQTDALRNRNPPRPYLDNLLVRPVFGLSDFDRTLSCEVLQAGGVSKIRAYWESANVFIFGH